MELETIQTWISPPVGTPPWDLKDDEIYNYLAKPQEKIKLLIQESPMKESKKKQILLMNHQNTITCKCGNYKEEEKEEEEKGSQCHCIVC
jgi:hypothetical protein